MQILRTFAFMDAGRHPDFLSSVIRGTVDRVTYPDVISIAGVVQ